MKSCWKFELKQRPEFSELVKKIHYLKPHNKPELKEATQTYLSLH